MERNTLNWVFMRDLFMSREEGWGLIHISARKNLRNLPIYKTPQKNVF